MKSLREKRILVTGGATGIGAEIVKSFVDYGAQVGVHYRKSEAEAKALKKEICGENTEVMLFQADLSESIEREQLIEEFLFYLLPKELFLQALLLNYLVYRLIKIKNILHCQIKID